MASATPRVISAPARSAAWRWNIIALLTTSQALAFIDRVNLSVAAPVLIRQFHYTAAGIGVLFSIFSWVNTGSQLLSGPFVDRVRARRGYTFGVSVWSLATVLCGTTMAFKPLSVYRALVGIGEGPMIPAGQRVVYETFPQSQRSFAIGMFFAGNKIGLALGIPLAAVLVDSFGLSWAFYVTGVLGFIWIAWFRLSYHEATPPATKTQSNIRWSTLLRYRTTWGLMLGQAGYLYTYYVFASWLPGYLVLQRKMTVLKSGFVGMLPFIVGVVMTVAGGWASDRLVVSGLRVTVVRKALSVGGLFGAAVFTLLGAYSNGVWPAVTFLTLAISSFSFATSSIQSMAVDIAPSHMVSSLTALQNVGGNVAGSFAPVITGLLISASGSFQVPLLATAAIVLVFGCVGFGLIVGNLDDILVSPIPG